MINILSFSQRKKREKKTFLPSHPSHPEFTYLSSLNLSSPCVIQVDYEHGFLAILFLWKEIRRQEF